MWRQIGMGLFLAMATAWVAPAVETPEPAAPAEEATDAGMSAERIQELIDQLDSSRFADRREATHALAGAGLAAIPALEAVVLEGSHVSRRRESGPSKRSC